MDAFWQAVTQHDWAEPEIPLEFRIYYNDQGDIICYSMEDIPGNYIVTDQHTFNQFRTDLKVRDGKLIKITQSASWKLVPSESAEYACAASDITVVVPQDYNNKKYWKVETTHEEN
jgi:hypothetical protein